MNEEPLPEFSEIKHLVQTLLMGDVWVACYKPLGISMIGGTEEDVLNGVEVAYNTHRPIKNTNK